MTGRDKLATVVAHATAVAELLEGHVDGTEVDPALYQSMTREMLEGDAEQLAVLAVYGPLAVAMASQLADPANPRALLQTLAQTIAAMPAED